MAIAFVQSLTIDLLGPTTPATGTFGATPGVGNLLVATLCDDSGTTVTSATISDNKGNTYTPITYQHGTASLGTYYAKNITSSATFTISVGLNQSNGSNLVAFIQEFSGCDIVAPLDQTAAGASGTSTTPTSGTTGTTAQADELVVVSHGFVNAATQTIALGSGYTNLASQWWKGAGAAGGQESKVISATGTQSGGFTIGASSAWQAQVATFKAAAATYTGRPRPLPTVIRM